MIFSGSHIRNIGWAAILAICVALFVALTFKVNAVKGEVRLDERRIVALERKRILLETEFQTRANQQQLANWNAVDFGYQAPQANQYMENERQLAALGVPRGADAPSPIRVARASVEEEGIFPQMVSPLTGRPARGADLRQNSTDEAEAHSHSGEMAGLAERLAQSSAAGRVGLSMSGGSE
ncbi:MAG: hypothetical protein ACK5NN_04585 [Sphingomonadaceae bacterium]